MLASSVSPQVERSPAPDQGSLGVDQTLRAPASDPPPPELDAGSPRMHLEDSKPERLGSGASPTEPAADGRPGSAPEGTDAGPGALPPAPRCSRGESLGPRGACYSILADLLSGNAARARCRARGEAWDLAAVRDAESNAFVAGLISEESWIGGSDAEVEGRWRWLRDGELFWVGDASGEPVNGAFANWNDDEPNGDNSLIACA